jgi:methylthioribulose-1-phosphate dehydratase
MNALPYDAARLEACTAQLVENVRELAALGWTPATSSNFSLRLDERHAAITISGRDKGRLSAGDVMVVDMDGQAVGSDHRPSAETLLHTGLYRRFPEVGCVLHTHSLAQTLASRLYGPVGHVRFEDYELIKAFRGMDTHEAEFDLPVLPNSQHMPTLAAQADVLMDGGPMWGYLIDGHGLYAWGKDMAEARRHLDAFEFLLKCELEMRKLRK